MSPTEPLLYRLLSLVAKSLEMGFTRVQIDRAPAPEPGSLRCGYHGEPGSLAIEVDEQQLVGAIADAATQTYLRGLLDRIGQVPELSAGAETDPKLLVNEPIESQARAFMFAHAAAKRADVLKEILFKAMKAQGRTAVDVPGAGAVTLRPGAPQRRLDVDAIVTLLRSKGVDVDAETLPRKSIPVADSVSVTWAR